MILDDYYHSVVETLSGYEDMDETDMDETDVSGKFPPFFTSLVLENRENQNFLTDFIPDLPKQENF